MSECPFELPLRLNKRGHFVCGDGDNYRDLTPRLSMQAKYKPYIVLAVNSHEDLVNACMNATGAYEALKIAGLDKDLPGYDSCLKFLEAALAQAVEEK